MKKNSTNFFLLHFFVAKMKRLVGQKLCNKLPSPAMLLCKIFAESALKRGLGVEGCGGEIFFKTPVLFQKPN